MTHQFKIMKQIESYHISKSEYGIITLIVNTVDKWLNYNHHDSNEDFHIFIMNENNQILEHKTIPIVEFSFDYNKEFRYLLLEQQEKDQIVFYWIPLRLIKGDEIVEYFKSKKK